MHKPESRRKTFTGNLRVHNVVTELLIVLMEAGRVYVVNDVVASAATDVIS